MPSSIDYCAQALIKLGADPIQSFDDGTREAQVFSTFYTLARDSELSAHLWNFNTFEFALSREVTAPPDARWTYSYILPADHLRSVQAFDPAGEPVDYEEENGRIFSNEDMVSLKYQRQIDENNFPAFFQALLVARLAYEAAEPIIGEPSVTRAKAQEYQQQQSAAKRIDNQSNRPRSIWSPESSSWVKSRSGGCW